MYRKIPTVSARFFGDNGYIMYAEHVSPIKQREFKKIAEKTLKQFSAQGVPAAYFVVHWLRGDRLGDLKASHASVLFNDQVLSPSLKKTITDELRIYGLDFHGDPITPVDIAGPESSIRSKRASSSKRRTKKKARIPRTHDVTTVLTAIKKKPSIQPCNTRFFSAGYSYTTTPGARKEVGQREGLAAIQRFARCDWGDVTRSQARSNNRLTIAHGGDGFGLIRASYRTQKNIEFWLIGDPRQRLITILLPEEN